MNLAQVALRQAQVNALKVLCPELDKSLKPSLLWLLYDLGEGSVLLRLRDRHVKKLTGPHQIVVNAALGQSALRKWGRLQLPNGQVAQSMYSESQRGGPNKRNTRNVKVLLNLLMWVSLVHI